MTTQAQHDPLQDEATAHFRALIESVGVKRFATAVGVSSRQVNRMLSGAQPNPVERVVKCLQAALPEAGDEALAFVCQEAGGFFVRESEGLDDASANAVKECAEAIAAISDGKVTAVDEREVREAISALIGLLASVRRTRGAGADARLDEGLDGRLKPRE